MGLVPSSAGRGHSTQSSETERLMARANLPKSLGASFLKFAGFVVIVVSILVAVANPLGLSFVFASAVSGGLVWSAGTVTQILFDLRTLALRDADRRESVSLEGVV